MSICVRALAGILPRWPEPRRCRLQAREGRHGPGRIDQPIVVKLIPTATGYKTASHDFMVWPAGRNSNNISGSRYPSSHDEPIEVATTRLDSQRTPSGDDGWGVYKKSLTVMAGVTHVSWATSPLQACKDNLNARIRNGSSKHTILGKEWKVSATAKLYFAAAADSKSNNKNRKNSANSYDVASEGIQYQVNVVCQESV